MPNGEASRYEDEAWKDRPLGRPPRNTQSARDRYGERVGWLRRWTFYAESMNFARGGADEDALEEIGSPQRRLWAELDVQHLGHSGSALGRRLLNEFFKPVLNDLFNRDKVGDHADLEPEARQALHAWHHLLTHRSTDAAAREWQVTTGWQSPRGAPPRRSMEDRIWERGLDAPRKFPVHAAPGLELITGELDHLFASLRRPHIDPPAPSDPLAALDLLLPITMARKVREAVARMLEYRHLLEAQGVEHGLGIDEHGRTELLTAALEQFARRIDNHESMLLLGPTSSGKSHVGRIAACYAVRTGGRVVVLLPTKALVTQAANEWKQFLQGTEGEGWRILPGSRDYPEHDESLARGRYEVAILIPEKLAGLMATGMNLNACRLLIVDELQHLADPQRGPKLEMLLTAVRASHPDIPVIGLSATMSPETAETVGRWLRVTPGAVVSAQHRPVPLDMLVCDDHRAKRLCADGRIREEKRDLQPLLQTWERTIRSEMSGVESYKWALALAISLLKEKKKVLCFVSARGDAEKLAAAAQAALRIDPEFDAVPIDSGPYEGRFAPQDSDTERLGSEFDLFPPTRLRDSVHEALRSGVGYHSARLEPLLRTVVEEGFRRGNIRLLFATDTLKLGLNLPADAVIIGSVTTPAGERRQRVLDPEAVAQRLGRAGRLHHSDRGEGYLMLPESPPSRARVEFGSTELDGLAKLAVPPGTAETPLDRALRTLRDVDGMFTHYLQHEARGAEVSSKLSDEWFATLLLQRITRDAPAFSEEELAEQARSLHGASLRAVSGAEPPNVQEVIQLLQSHELIGPSLHRDGMLTITGLGRAVSTSGLPFADTLRVQEMADECRQGAGDLTLLWIAAQSQHVRESSGWVSIVPQEVDDNIEDRMMRAVLDLAGVFATTDASGRKTRAKALASHLFVEHLPPGDLVGTGPAADRLRQLITGLDEAINLETVNALLRACVLLLWTSGCPMSRLERAAGKNVSTQVGAPGHNQTHSVEIHAADVRTLGENTSYLFDAAAELTAVRPDGTGFRRLEAISQSLEVGVPLPLVPLARLGMAATHRERIVNLIPFLAEPFEDLAELVDRRMAGLPAILGNPEAKANARLAVSSGERREICSRLRAKENRHQERGLQLRTAYREVPIPGARPKMTFGTVAQDLTNPAPKVLAQQVSGVLRACGVSVVDHSPSGLLLRLASRQDPALTVRMAVETEPVTAQRLAAASGSADVVLTQKGITAGAAARAGRSCGDLVAVEPAILIELMVRIIQVEKPSMDDRTNEEEDEEEDEWLETGGSLGDGMERVGHCLLEKLLVAPPILTRTDVNRLIAGLTVAAPPPLPLLDSS